MIRTDLYQFCIVLVLIRRNLIFYLRLHLCTVGVQEKRAGEWQYSNKTICITK
jgi:hypothetical protein